MATKTLGSAKCQPRAIDRSLHARWAIRARELEQSYERQNDDNTTNEPMTPACAFTAVTLTEPDPFTLKNIRDAYTQSLDDRKEGVGHIYVFRDRRDTDAATLVKIGETSRSPQVRLSEWIETLGASDDEDIVLLCTFSCLRRRLAERIARELLWPHREHLRVNRLTNRRLTEYFHVNSLRALKVLLFAIVRHVNWFHRQL